MIARFLIALVATPVFVVILLGLVGLVYPACSLFAIVRYREPIGAQGKRYGAAVWANSKDCFGDIAQMWGRI